MTVRELVDKLEVKKCKPLSFLKEEHHSIPMDAEILSLDDCRPEDYMEEADSDICNLRSISISCLVDDFQIKTFHVYIWNKHNKIVIEER